jgi:hypothetical protein
VARPSNRPPSPMRDYLIRMIHDQDQLGMAYGGYAMNLWKYYDALVSVGFSPEFSESMVMSLDSRLAMRACGQMEDD